MNWIYPIIISSPYRDCNPLRNEIKDKLRLEPNNMNGIFSNDELHSEIEHFKKHNIHHYKRHSQTFPLLQGSFLVEIYVSQSL